MFFMQRRALKKAKQQKQERQEEENLARYNQEELEGIKKFNMYMDKYKPGAVFNFFGLKIIIGGWARMSGDYITCKVIYASATSIVETMLDSSTVELIIAASIKEK